MRSTAQSGSAANLGVFQPRMVEARAAIPAFERRLTLLLFVVAPLLGLLLRFGLGSQRIELTLVKAWDDVVIGLFGIVGLLRLPGVLGKLKSGWLVPVGLLGFLVLMAVKVAGTDWGHVEFFAEPLGMEVKPIYYLAISVVLYLAMGQLHLRHWIGRIEFFAAMMILGYFLQLATGAGAGARASAVEEANYDGFIVGLGLFMCYHLRSEVKLRSWLIFGVATLLTLSRTGLLSLGVVGVVVLLRHRQFKWLLAGFLLLVPAAIVIFESRAGATSASQLDRVRMWQSFFLTLSQWHAYDYAFGIMPGVPIRYYDPYIQFFIDFQSVEAHNVAGLHPFNYHGMHIRFLLSWGIVGALTVVLALASAAWRSGFLFGLLLLFVFVQGFSMGVIYLTTVAVPFFLVAFEFWRIGAAGRAARPVPARRTW